MRRILLATLLGGLLSAPAAAQQAPAESHDTPHGKSTLDVHALFANTCGFCHSNGGRAAGRGPQLMNTKRSDDFIRYRVKHGKEGAMPAFATMLGDADIDVIIAYIRALKPE